MVAYLLIRKSNIACLADDATTAVDLASAAQDVPGGIEPRICALAAQQEARGWAMIGDVDHCRRQLDTAAELLRVHSSEPDPAGPFYLQHCDLDILEEQAATCFRNVGRPQDAIPIFERKWHSWPGGPISPIPALSTTPLPPAEPISTWNDDGGNTALALTVSSGVGPSGRLARRTAAHCGPRQSGSGSPRPRNSGTRRP